MKRPKMHIHTYINQPQNHHFISWPRTAWYYHGQLVIISNHPKSSLLTCTRRPDIQRREAWQPACNESLHARRFGTRGARTCMPMPCSILSQPQQRCYSLGLLFQGAGTRKQDVQSPEIHSCQRKGQSSPASLLVGLRQWLLLGSLLPEVQFASLLCSSRAQLLATPSIPNY